MKIYIDVLLVENFIIDMFILMITSKIVRIRVNNKYLIAASFIGAIYTLVGIFPDLKFFSIFPFQVIVAYLMMSILLKSRCWKTVIKATLIYIIIAFILSGISLSFALWQNSYSLKSVYKIENYSLKYLVISIILVYIVLDRVTSYLRERALITNFTYDIELYIKDIKFVIKGFLDTGNELREPITNLPCIIVEEKYLNSFIEEEEDKTYYIPYSAIGFKGKLRGFKVDKVLIRGISDNWREVSAIICPCKDELNREKEFNALLSRGVI